jgi:acetyl-CoA acyltransferase
MKEAVIVAAVRSAVGKGKKDGALAGVHPTELSASVMRGAIARAGIEPGMVDDIFWGCAMPEASQGLNVARLSSLRAGIPVEVPSATINRFCSSGLQTVALAAQEIMCGNADIVMAGGVEMMSQVPMSGYHTRLSPELTESYIGMGFTAERVAERWKVTREDQDRWALESQQKATAAWKAQRFDDQIVPIETTRFSWKGKDKHETTATVRRDELPRPETTMEGLAKLKPAFKVNGTVTAGNASQMTDGAAATLVVSERFLARTKLAPLARFVSFSVRGVAPEVMGIGPVEAIPAALARAGIRAGDLARIELNEAFAAQSLASVRALGLDPARVNPDGGAIALGHPLGCTGAKLTATLLHGLARTRERYGMVSMCIGGGMGAAAVFERA